MNTVNRLIFILAASLIIFGYGSLLSQNTRQFNGYSLLLILFISCILIQIVVFIPSKIFNSEKFYDFTGSLTFISMTLLALLSAQNYNTRQIVAASLVLIWTIRLGFFLFTRIMKAGEDSRFILIRKYTIVFFFAWFMQGFWVAITISPVLVVLCKKNLTESPLMISEILGIAVWAIGLLIEIVADNQKSEFRKQSANKEKFIQSGLWKISRHPNYCGQIILWVGITLFCFSSLEGYELASLVSPLFVYLLLTKLSGVPILEKKAIKKWGNDPEYLKYLQNTPEMFFGSGHIKYLKKKE